MGLLFNWRIWLLGVILAGSVFGCFKSYQAGEAKIQAKFDSYVATQTSQALSESMARRHREDVLIAKYKEANNAYTNEKNKYAAYVVSTSNSLHDFEATNNSAGNSDSSSSTGVNGARKAIVDECSRAIVQMEADVIRLRTKVMGLQDYIESVELNK